MLYFQYSCLYHTYNTVTKIMIKAMTIIAYQCTEAGTLKTKGEHDCWVVSDFARNVCLKVAAHLCCNHWSVTRVEIRNLICYCFCLSAPIAFFGGVILFVIFSRCSKRLNISRNKKICMITKITKNHHHSFIADSFRHFVWKLMFLMHLAYQV